MACCTRFDFIINATTTCVHMYIAATYTNTTIYSQTVYAALSDIIITDPLFNQSATFITKHNIIITHNAMLQNVYIVRAN